MTIFTKMHNKHMTHILMVGRLGNNAGEIFRERTREEGVAGQTEMFSGGDYHGGAVHHLYTELGFYIMSDNGTEQT